MIPEGIKERFEYYRKWFKSFLRKEFLNLPSEQQERFLYMIDKFRKDCEVIYKEHKDNIKEKTVRVTISQILRPDNKEENFIVYGKTDTEKEEFRISYPAKEKIPKVGESKFYAVYSMDGINWFASKEELITGRIKK